MDKKKILIVGRTFYPQLSPRSFRTTELAIELARQGHLVTVVLPQNIQEDIESKFDNTFGIVFRYYGPLLWKSLTKSKISWIGDWKRKLGRLLFLLFEYPNIEIYFKLPTLLKKLKGFDLMISIAVPHENHWAISKARTKTNPIAKVWVADCGDPFMTNVLETIPPPFYFGWLERSFLKKCDYVSVPTEGSIKAYDQKYKEKFKVIPQGFNFNDVRLVTTKSVHAVPTFAYAGGVSKTGIRSLHLLLDRLKAINVPFKFHIYSSNAKVILSDVIGDFNDQVTIHDSKPRNALLYDLSDMDFLINLDNGTHFNTPSKLIDYSLVKRPILNINPSDPSKELIVEFLNQNYQNALVISDIDKYNIQVVANQFSSLQ